MENQNLGKLAGLTFATNYKLIKKLGEGAFGEIYLCINKQNQEELAIKLERADTQHPQIQFEAKLYNYLQNDGNNASHDKGIPKLHHFGTEQNYNFIVLDLLGKSLEDIFIQQQKRLTLKTVCQLGDQMIQRIEYFHSRSFIHRDIKPDNFLMGIVSKAHKVYLIDYGLSKRFISKDGKHIPYRDGKSLTGTARYASVNTHLGIEQSRRDDVESIGYVLLYFLRGVLPWQNLQGNNKEEKYKKIMEKKMQTPVEIICKGFPSQFVSYLCYCKNLRFEDKPDYSYLRSLFKEIMNEYKFEYDYQYDWNKNVKQISQQPSSQQYQLEQLKNIDNNKNNEQQLQQIQQQKNQLIQQKTSNLNINNNINAQQLQQEPKYQENQLQSSTNRILPNSNFRNTIQLKSNSLQQQNNFQIKRNSFQNKEESSNQQSQPYDQKENSNSRNRNKSIVNNNSLTNSRSNTLNSNQGRKLVQQRVQDRITNMLLNSGSQLQKQTSNIQNSVPLPKIINHKQKF